MEVVKDLMLILKNQFALATAQLVADADNRIDHWELSLFLQLEWFAYQVVEFVLCFTYPLQVPPLLQ